MPFTNDAHRKPPPSSAARRTRLDRVLSGAAAPPHPRAADALEQGAAQARAARSIVLVLSDEIQPYRGPTLALDAAVHCLQVLESELLDLALSTPDEAVPLQLPSEPSADYDTIVVEIDDDFVNEESTKRISAGRGWQRVAAAAVAVLALVAAVTLIGGLL